MLVPLMKAIFMPRLTRPAPSLTTAKHRPARIPARRASSPRVARLAALAALAGSALAFAGCSTPGPTHVYLASLAEHPIIDRGPGLPDVEISTHLIAVNDLYGMAYDPFTDHLFLRIFPGNYVHVVDRPARAPKRAFAVPDLPEGPGDLAIRSSDRNLFFAHPTLPALLETTLYGRTVRTVTLEHLAGPPAGVAYDQIKNRLLILPSHAAQRITLHDLAGQHIGEVILDHAVRPVSLAYDSNAAEFYAPLRDRPAVGVFDSNGRLQRTLPHPDGRPHDFIDVGPRSLIRMF